MYVSGWIIMYNLEVDVHLRTYIHTRFVGLLVQTLLLNNSETMKCFNLFRFLYWATMMCRERSEQQQSCVVHKLVNILIQSSNYGVGVFVWQIKTNIASRQRGLKSYLPLLSKFACNHEQNCGTALFQLFSGSLSTLFMSPHFILYSQHNFECSDFMELAEAGHISTSQPTKNPISLCSYVLMLQLLFKIWEKLEAWYDYH